MNPHGVPAQPVPTHDQLPPYQTAAMPVSGGYGFPPPTHPVTPPPARSGLTLLLTVLTVVFFVATVLFTTLYLTKNNSYKHQVATVHTKSNQLAADQTQLDDLKKQLQSTKDELADLQQKQTGTQNQLDEITKEKQVISNCLTLLAEAGQAAQAGDKATYTAKTQQADSVCAEAEKYLD